MSYRRTALKLIHLSDLHFNAANSRRVASVLSEARAANADHLIISGDLVASAHPEEFRALRSLLNEHGFLHREKLTVVPGNHDLFGHIYQTFGHPSEITGRIQGLRSLASTAHSLWNLRRKLLAYDADSYGRDVAHFRSHFPHAFAGHLTASGHLRGFPFARLLPNDIALIGVDSNFYLPRVANLFRLARGVPSTIRSGDVGRIGENLSGSTGYVNIESLQSLLAHPEVRRRRKILVMHHYLYSDEAIGDAMTDVVMRETRLVNRRQVIQLLRDHRIELVLHGHWHVTNEYRAGGARVVNGGGSLWSGLNVIHVGTQQLRITLKATPSRVRT